MSNGSDDDRGPHREVPRAIVEVERQHIRARLRRLVVDSQAQNLVRITRTLNTRFKGYDVGV